jgi:hypothetical protein
MLFLSPRTEIGTWVIATDQTVLRMQKAWFWIALRYVPHRGRSAHSLRKATMYKHAVG